MSLTFLLYSYCTWISLNCPGRYKTWQAGEENFSWSSPKCHCGHRYYFPIKLSFPIDCSLLAVNLQHTTAMRWDPNPSNEAFMLCSRRAGPLSQKPPCPALLHPTPHWTRPIISVSQSSTALSLCSQHPSAHQPSTETSDLPTSSHTHTKQISVVVLLKTSFQCYILYTIL